MEITGSSVLVTGANRGIGAEFVRQLQSRGAAKIYAAARRAETIDAVGVEKLALDVTDPDQVSQLADQVGDLTLLINNAGISTGASLIGSEWEAIRREFETNVFGALAVSRALAPILARNGGGAILNVNSALSWFVYPGATSYSATKAAMWSITDGLRVDLAAQRTQVVGLHMGAVDTEMMAGYAGAMLTPEAVVSAALDGIASGATEVVLDDGTRQIKASLGLDPAERYAEMLGAEA